MGLGIKKFSPIKIVSCLIISASFIASFFLLSSGPRHSDSYPSENKLQNSKSSYSDTRFVSRVPGSHIKVLDPDGVLTPATSPDLWHGLFVFRLLRPPETDVRNLLVSKYDFDTKPYSGWALALRNIGISKGKYRKGSNNEVTPVVLRPEVYLKGKKFGGWFPHSEFSVRVNSWYGLVVSILDQQYITVNIVELGDSDKLTKKGSSKIKYLGASKIKLSQIDKKFLKFKAKSSLKTIRNHKPLLIGAPFKSNLSISFGLSGVFAGIKTNELIDLVFKYSKRTNNAVSKDSVLKLKSNIDSIGRVDFLTTDGLIDLSHRKFQIVQNKVGIRKKKVSS